MLTAERATVDALEASHAEAVDTLPSHAESVIQAATERAGSAAGELSSQAEAHSADLCQWAALEASRHESEPGLVAGCSLQPSQHKAVLCSDYTAHLHASGRVRQCTHLSPPC